MGRLHNRYSGHWARRSSRQANGSLQQRVRYFIEHLESRVLLSDYTLTSIGVFGTNTTGANPWSNLAADTAGNLFGTTNLGGAFGCGTVFEIARGTTTVQAVASFNRTNGANPYGGVTLDAGGNLFGTTAEGGASGCGTIFQIPAGTHTIQTLASFNGSNGADPRSGITLDVEGNLYGTTLYGGTDDYGTVFRVPSGTDTIQTLVSFNDTNGARPWAGITLDANGNLYGTTQCGGDDDDGTVFEISTGTNTVHTAVSFSNANGAHPCGGITLDARGNLYGTTQYTTAPNGSAEEYGTVFEIPAGTNMIQTLAWFNITNGAYPYGSVVLDAAGNLYGTTSYGGAGGYGTIFEIPSAGDTLQTLASFNKANGANPYGGLALDSFGNLYGTTAEGGTYGCGTIFKIPSGTDTVQTFVSFNDTNTNAASGAGLTLDADGNLYGTTASGGAYGYGTVFEIPTHTNTIQTLVSFDKTNGANPFGGVTLDTRGNLYGTTGYGGTWGYGTVFKISSGSRAIQTLASFDGSNGADPRGAPTLDAGGNLYGTTASDGAYGYGTVFEIPSGTTTIHTLTSFNGSNGAYPASRLALDVSGNLYGTTSSGGTYGVDDGYGVVFKIARGANTIQTLASFSLSNGAYPYGGVTLDPAGNLYGTTSYGGAGGCGTVFKIPRGTATVQTLVSFDGTNGEGPRAGLSLDARGNLYGTTASGGAKGYGTVFEIPIATKTVQTLVSFDGSNGADPWSGVTEDSQGNLYGTTTSGGPGNEGAAFQLTPLGVRPMPGDINGDGRVDLADFLTLVRHFGQLGTPDQGDLNGDGTINLADLLILVRNFGRSAPTGSPVSTTQASSHLPASNPLSASRRVAVADARL